MLTRLETFRRVSRNSHGWLTGWLFVEDNRTTKVPNNATGRHPFLFASDSTVD